MEQQQYRPFETFYPQDTILKQHIAYYYFYKSDASDFKTAYYSFPNITTPVNIHKNVSVKIHEASVEIAESHLSNFTAIVNQIRDKPLLVRWEGKLDKVTIVFKPLGLNHFVRNPLSEAMQGMTQIFDCWDNTSSFKSFLQSFYSCQENFLRVNIIEEFLLTLYSSFKHRDSLAKAILLLSDFNEERSVREIAQILRMSTRSFDRLFYKHMGMSPVCFRKVARFRHSLQNRLFDQKFKKLTTVGYESNFYDQSYFIKVYNKLTGANPKKFFDLVDKFGDNRLIFQFTSK